MCFHFQWFIDPLGANVLTSALSIDFFLGMYNEIRRFELSIPQGGKQDLLRWSSWGSATFQCQYSKDVIIQGFFHSVCYIAVAKMYYQICYDTMAHKPLLNMQEKGTLLNWTAQPLDSRNQGQKLWSILMILVCSLEMRLHLRWKHVNKLWTRYTQLCS